MNKFLWEKPPTNPLRISRKECHVWKVDLRAVNKENFQLDILSEDEQKRLSSFKFAKDRFCHGVTHSLKRWVLASYLNERPEKLVFTREKYGIVSGRIVLKRYQLLSNLIRCCCQVTILSIRL